MDELILIFTKEQYKKYQELLTAKDITINIDSVLPTIEPTSSEKAEALILEAIKNAEKLSSFKKRDAFFSYSLSDDEKKRFTPIYYEAIRNIDLIRGEIYAQAASVSKKLSEIERAYGGTCKNYSELLPYKAALSNDEKYRSRIEALELKLKANITHLEEQKRNEISFLSKLSLISDKFIPELMDKTLSASGSPSFKSFESGSFFSAVHVFIERMKNI